MQHRFSLMMVHQAKVAAAIVCHSCLATPSITGATLITTR
jgi:hypothetical protein